MHLQIVSIPLVEWVTLSDVTQILDRVHDGDAKAADELLPLVYEELRQAELVKLRFFVGLTFLCVLWTIASTSH